MVGTALVANYADAVESVFDSRGWDRSRSRCLRLVVEHPPMSSRVVLRYELPDRP